MGDPTYPLFPVFSFVGFILVLIPLPWHLEAWNSGTCYYMIWTALGCLSQFVNSVVWRTTAINYAPIWCDISSRLLLAVSVAIPAASLCINRRLYNIARLHAVVLTREEKRRAVLIDSLLCLGMPCLVMILYYVVQGHRFDIYEDVGCYPVVFDTLPAYFLVSMWPLLFGLISAVYCGLSLYSFAKRRAQFTEFMSSNNAITISRYFRLMALASTDMLCTTPFALYSIYLNIWAGPEPWVSWADTHFDFSRVDQYPDIIWRMSRPLVISIELTRWFMPVCAIVFFAFFGFADEARRHYVMVFWWAAKWVSLKRPVKGFKAGSGFRSPKPLLPSYVASPPAYTPTTPSYKKPRASSFSSSWAESKFDFDTDKTAGLSTPSLPKASVPRDTFLSRTSSSIPPSPAVSECPTIDRLPFETDAAHHISISDAIIASRPSSPEAMPRGTPPMFHRPFSPPAVYPTTTPCPSSRPGEAPTVSVRRESEADDAA